MKQIIRIIGGRFRGKKIAFQPQEGLRPTTDRVRETLFNWLMHDIKGATCLDAFAGSGALGLEAFSRGAAGVDFIEKHPAVAATLRKTVSQFNDSSLKVIQADSRQFIDTTHKKYDIVFLDPPFAERLLETYLMHLLKVNILNPHGLVYIESSYDMTSLLIGWNVLKQKKAGMVFYGLIQPE